MLQVNRIHVRIQGGGGQEQDTCADPGGIGGLDPLENHKL